MNPSHFYATLQSPIGELVLTSSGKAITGLYTSEHSGYEQAKKGKFDSKPFKQAIKQLTEYFDGKRSSFELPLESEGTQFQKKTWKALLSIPCGETKSYGQIAKALKAPKASRAAGAAIGKNPIGIFVPCHRVVGADGSLTGYAGGLKVKKWLLDHESKLPARKK